MTAAFASDHRAEQLESLRRRMAEMSGAVAARADDLLPESESGLPLPLWLAESLPPDWKNSPSEPHAIPG